jgi:hypothetical protein
VADERKPSEVTEEPWLWADRAAGEHPPANENSGKFLVFVSVESVDQVWEKIKQATIDGHLGWRSKVATSKPNPRQRGPKSRLICVYTYDGTDASDLHRVREELQALGIKRKLTYKADSDTRQGNTGENWRPEMAKYRE